MPSRTLSSSQPATCQKKAVPALSSSQAVQLFCSRSSSASPSSPLSSHPPSSSLPSPSCPQQLAWLLPFRLLPSFPLLRLPSFPHPPSSHLPPSRQGLPPQSHVFQPSWQRRHQRYRWD